ncbi:MAG: restriction endonuclease subunit S [Lachnospiraceae bacterium]|nr:restriction endonuclease subunit S [Lachnospiraceae bacterium]
MRLNKREMIELNDVCSYVSERIGIDGLTLDNYISTENMISNKEGICKSSGLPKINAVRYRKEDVLVSNIRPYFKKIWFADREGGCSSDVLNFRANENYNSKFLYYVLSDDEFFRYSVGTSRGTKMPRGDKAALLKYSVPKITIAEQERIVEILSIFDDKIELNKKINNNLLEQAVALFNQLISGQQKNGCLGDYCSVKSGFAFKSSWWQDTGVRVIKIGSINQDNLDLNSCSFVSEDKASLAADFITKGGDLLIAMTGATIGKFSMVPKTNEILLVNQRVGKFFLGSNPIDKLPFIYCQLKQDEIYNEVINRGQGSAQPNISAADIMSIPCVIPEKDMIDSFNSTTSHLFELIINNQSEKKQLEVLRNSLLPKLMSGELDVSEIVI